MMREDREPQGAKKRNETVLKRSKGLRDYAAKTGRELVPHEDPKAQAKIAQQSTCQFGKPITVCKYPSENRRTWCNACFLFDKQGDAREQPREEEQLPKVL